MNSAAPLVSLQIADTLISSGCCGINLAKLLAECFPTARRAEVYLGVTIAVTDLRAELHDLQVDLLIAEAELQDARRLHRLGA